MKHRVQLLGHTHDLEHLHDGFPSGDIHVVKERDDYFLAGPDLDALPDELRVHARANHVLAELLSAACIDAVVDASRVYTGELDEARCFVFGSAVATTGTSFRASLSVDGASTSATTRAQQALCAMRANPYAKNACDLLRRHDASWAQLYRAYDEIKAIRNPVQAGWCSQADLSRFTGSANSAAVAGLAARHADPPGKRIPSAVMDLPEARSFVRALLECALDFELARAGTSP